MGVETVHLVFTPAAAADLGVALKQLGRGDVVLNVFDSFELGPINPPEPDARKLWIETHTGFDEWNWPHLDARVFWRHALSPGVITARSPGRHGVRRMIMRAFWNGCGASAMRLAKSST